MNAVTLRPDHKKVPQKPPAVEPTTFFEKASFGLLFLAVAAGCVLLIVMKVIEPRRSVAVVQLQTKGVQKISLGAFHERLLFERAREIARLNLVGEDRPWYDHVAVDYRYLSSLGFAGGILDRMTRELILREEAMNRGLTASESEIDRVIEEAASRGKTAASSPSTLVTGSLFLSGGPQGANMSAISVAGEQTVPTIKSTSLKSLSTKENGSEPVIAKDSSSSKRQNVLDVPPANLPFNYRDIIRVAILEKKLKSAFHESVPRQLDQVKLKLIRFEVETDARINSEAISNVKAFDELYTRVTAGAVRNATGMVRDWSTANELSRDFNPELSAAVFRFTIGDCLLQLTPAARGWYLAKIDSREVRAATDEWRLARAEDAFNEWMAHQQTRITQFPLWMEHVPLMAEGTLVNERAGLSIPTLPSQQGVGERKPLSPGLQGSGSTEPIFPFDKKGNRNENTAGLLPSGKERTPRSGTEDPNREKNPVSVFQQAGNAGVFNSASVGNDEQTPAWPSRFDQPRQSQPLKP